MDVAHNIHICSVVLKLAGMAGTDRGTLGGDYLQAEH